jgi:hypothetical protein
MNKDQKLLEEAYQSIYESTIKPLYIGPAQDKQKWTRWLKKQDYKINKDGSVSINHSVRLDEKNLTKLPFNFKKIEGSFNCSFNKLATLEGCPEIVKGEFSCHDNKLTSLIGGPKQVEGNYICYSNDLTSLEGAPKVFKGDLNLSFTKITSLPDELEVGESLSVYDTPLSSLPNGLKVGGGLHIHKTKITSLPSGLKVGSFLDLSNIEILSLPSGLKVRSFLNLQNTPITKVSSLPIDLEVGGAILSDYFNKKDFIAYRDKRLKVIKELSPEFDIDLEDF